MLIWSSLWCQLLLLVSHHASDGTRNYRDRACSLIDRYGVQFAQTAGLDNSYIFQIILASVNVAASFPGILAVDRAGRRPVLLVGAAVMFTGQIVVGAISKSHPNDPTAGNVLIAFTCIFIAAFASSWGPVAWVVCGETFPIRLSSLCVTLGTGGESLL